MAAWFQCAPNISWIDKCSQNTDINHDNRDNDDNNNNVNNNTAKIILIITIIINKL